MRFMDSKVCLWHDFISSLICFRRVFLMVNREADVAVTAGVLPGVTDLKWK